jgi:hypothetical protein
VRRLAPADKGQQFSLEIRHLLAPADQRLALRGQAHAPARAHEEGCSQLAFQQADTLRHPSLTEADLAGGPVDRPLPDDGHEGVDAGG